MRTIDADAHVIETGVTWKYMSEAERRYKPIPVSAEDGELRPGTSRLDVGFWAIDGRLRPRERNIGDETAREAREMTDVGRRIAHMSELSIDIQILYPSLFLRPLTRTKEIELALVRSYNKWLAEIWSSGQNRLRWVAIPPIQSLADPNLVRDELATAKEKGACGIFMNGFSYDRELWDPYFFPLYEIAQDLDMPVCLHAGNDSWLVHDFFDKSDALAKFRFPVMSAFHSLLQKDIPKRFPQVRWGFVEAGCGWLPFVLSELKLRFSRWGKRFSDNPLADNNMFVCCQVNEDIAYVASVAGEDNLMIGTDYGHNDNSTQIEALRMLKDGNSLAPALIDKILGDNPARLYGL